MKTSVYYDKDCRYCDVADEIILEYHGKQSDLALQSFLEIRTNQDIVLSVKQENFKSESFLMLLDKVQAYPRLKILIEDGIPENEVFIELNKRNMLYFVKYLAHTYEDFYYLASKDVSDIYIGLDLGFDLKKVDKIANEWDIVTRVVTNVALARHKELPYYMYFFIRPEDIDEYSKYIDVFELAGPANIVNVSYKIYFEQKEWKGQLGSLILGLQGCEYNSQHIVPLWGRRAYCNRKCLGTGECKLCPSMVDFSNTLEKAEIVVPKDLAVPEIEVLEEEPIVPKIKPNF